MDDRRDPAEESFEQTLDDILAEGGPSNQASPARDAPQTDPSFATPHEANPFAAEDLRGHARQAPRTDKQGDAMPQ